MIVWDQRALLFDGVAHVDRAQRMATMKAWAQAARIPSDIRKQMGRWQASVDEGWAVKVNVMKSEVDIEAHHEQLEALMIFEVPGQPWQPARNLCRWIRPGVDVSWSIVGPRFAQRTRVS